MYCLQVVPETLLNPHGFFAWRLAQAWIQRMMAGRRPRLIQECLLSFFVAIWKIMEFEGFSLGEFSHFPHEENRSVAGEALSSGLGLHSGSERSVVRVPWGGFFANSQLCRFVAYRLLDALEGRPWCNPLLCDGWIGGRDVFDIESKSEVENIIVDKSNMYIISFGSSFFTETGGRHFSFFWDEAIFTFSYSSSSLSSASASSSSFYTHILILFMIVVPIVDLIGLTVIVMIYTVASELLLSIPSGYWAIYSVVCRYNLS